MENNIFENKKETNRLQIVIAGFLAIVLAVSLCFEAVSTMPETPEEIFATAERYYESGRYENAFYYIEAYCEQVPGNYDGYMTMGNWYMEQGNEEKAYKSYKQAAYNKDIEENQLTESSKFVKLSSSSEGVALKIEPSAKYTKDMVLCFENGNLAPDKKEQIRLDDNLEISREDENCLTTKWFPVGGEGKSLVLTGDINCAIWQFKDTKDRITVVYDDNDFKTFSSVRHDSMTYSTVEIPDDTIEARVMYFDNTINDTIDKSENVFIYYGNKPVGYTNAPDVQLEIPDLCDGQYITYENKKWQLYNGDSFEALDWESLEFPVNTTCRIDGDLCGAVTIEYADADPCEADPKIKEYGIRYSTESSLSVCRRLGDAEGMNFNYLIGDEWASEGKNDFDSAYPWSEMKLCAVSLDPYGEKQVVYQGDEGFATDGSKGNVMVEIPKFYVKRTVVDGMEEIWISGTQHEGYVLEPVFKDTNGQELDFVYMSAYLGAEKDDKIVSEADTYPTLMLTYGETLDMAENNGNGFSEMNFLMCSALQKLFIVETGTIDASTLFPGDTFMYYYYETGQIDTSGLAALDAEDSNTIVLNKNYGTEKLVTGSSITIFEGWESYENNNGTQREIEKIVENNDYLTITFDGEPMDIKKSVTCVSNIPEKTAKTAVMDYCTGTLSGVAGKHSFKYRNIENLYGSALIMLDDDAYMQDGKFYYQKGNDGFVLLNASIPDQHQDLSNYGNVNLNCCIKAMTYDESNPTIMLPSEVGNGASCYNYYGDFWMYKNFYNGTKKYFLYGGADDNSRLAGPFQMRAIITGEDVSFSFYSARIMYR